MKINELKEMFNDVIYVLKELQNNDIKQVKLCVDAFKKGTDLYDRLPEIEQLLASINSSEPENVLENYKIINCIAQLGRSEENQYSTFEPINLARKGEETTEETIQIAWISLNEMDEDTPSVYAMKKVLKEKMYEILEEFLMSLNILINLSKM